MTNREETNSAIGSWSGFIYQGLCGLLVALRMIKERQEAVAGFSLQLDAYEDFSILNEHGRIYSLHQCKCIKNVADYTKEFEKITDKIEANKDKLQDPDNPHYYFHCNRSVSIDEKYRIAAYPFEEGKTYCEPGDIQRLLDHEVNQMKKDGSNTEVVRASLETLVNGNVLNTQQKYFEADSSGRLWKISRQQNIPFADIRGKLALFMTSYAPGDFLHQMKMAYILGMDKMADEEDDGESRRRVDVFINRLSALSEDEMRRFIQRVNPKEKVTDTFECWHAITSSERVNYLYNLITEFPLGTDNLDWHTEHSTQTPSTLGNDEKKRRIVRRIYENQANLDVLWLYDWIVGHQDEHIENIEESAQDIMNITDAELDTKSIFHAKKVGIMTKQEKREGKYD